MKRILLKWIIGLALFGVVLSTYSLAHKTGFTSGALCNLSDTFSCDIVNQGPYSEIYGIPVAAIGVVGYALLLIGVWMKMKNPQDRSLSMFILLASYGGLAFALYLTSLEAFVLYAWCIVCLLSQVTIAALAVLSSLIMISEKRV
ncbi:MAG: vitamin K epoxide reductase family protein [Candidatus Uhrbacteria bacterium]|nr:vitamin K epoxide reductase family protein [Candidatus Uhrbacteria bacterium]